MPPYHRRWLDRRGNAMNRKQDGSQQNFVNLIKKRQKVSADS